MPPYLTNQNVDVPTKQAYLNLELTPLSLFVATTWASLSLCHRSLSQASDLVISFCIYLSLVATTPSRSFTQAYRVFTCNLKWAFEAQ